MDWASVWSWSLVTMQWCLYVFVFYIMLKWWARAAADHAKIRFIEAKIDAILDHFDVGFNEAFSEHIAKVLREKGDFRAKSEYIRQSGNDLADAEDFLRGLSGDDEEAEMPTIDPPHGNLDADELHAIVDQVFRTPPRKSRRRR